MKSSRRCRSCSCWCLFSDESRLRTAAWYVPCYLAGGRYYSELPIGLSPTSELHASASSTQNFAIASDSSFTSCLEDKTSFKNKNFTMRLSGLQKDVLALYRQCLRESRKKPKVRLLPSRLRLRLRLRCRVATLTDALTEHAASL